MKFLVEKEPFSWNEITNFSLFFLHFLHYIKNKRCINRSQKEKFLFIQIYFVIYTYIFILLFHIDFSK